MFSFGMFMPEPAQPFNVIYEAYSVSMMPNGEEKMKRHDADNGGKIFLPPTALQHLTRLNTTYPMLFKLTNVRTGRSTHCGVLEFEADEGKCYLPYWMMRNLLCEEGMELRVESASLQVATFALFQPQTSEFSEITDQRAMLEQALRSFACLTTGDMIGIRYNDKLYELRVLETRPAEAVTVIECDLHTEFAPPADYVPEPKDTKTKSQADEEMEETHYTPQFHIPSFVPFHGSGNRLDGKAISSSNISGISLSDHAKPKRGIPDYDYEVGTINFVRDIRPFMTNNGVGGNGSDSQNNTSSSFSPFAGSGVSLRSSKTPNSNNSSSSSSTKD